MQVGRVIRVLFVTAAAAVALAGCAPPTTVPGDTTTVPGDTTTSTTSTSTTSTSTTTSTSITTTSTSTTTTSSTTTTTVPSSPVVTNRLASGNNHTCAITTAGAAKCWGSNAAGQLGNGTTTSSNTPVAVTGVSSGVQSMVAGESQTCAINAAGGVVCWGSNASGQLGDGSTTNRSEPTPVQGLSSGVSVLAAGDNHTCAGLAAGGVKCWGWGSSGQLGNNAITTTSSPVDVSGISGQVVSLSAGYAHTCAVLSGGSVKCWGRAGSGQIGNGSTVNSRVPVDVTGATSGGTAVVGGGAHSCAVVSSAARCWGLNLLGQIGDGSTTNRTTSVAVANGSPVSAVAAGASHSCALFTTGGVKCWGDNASGVLGTGSTSPASSTAPLQVSGLTSGVVEVSAGAAHTCVLTNANAVRCWGVNDYGQLGNGGTSSASSPVTVNGL